MTHFTTNLERWLALVPENIAIDQVAWEKRQAIVRAVIAGATQREIAAALGVSRVRISDQFRQQTYRNQRSWGSPVQQWLSGGGQLADLAHVLMKSTKRREALSISINFYPAPSDTTASSDERQSEPKS